MPLDDIPTFRVRATAGDLATEALLGSDPLVIGSGVRADLRLDHPDLDPYHVEIVASGREIVVRDLGSRAGTFLAGPTRLRITEARAAQAELLLGKVFVRIHPDRAATGQAAAPATPAHEPARPRRARAGEPEDAVSLRLLGCSEAMGKLRDRIRRYAPTPEPVLILGETGTGKELVARALHEAGASPRGPFVAVDCNAMPDTMIESELFGHARGAFTGAVERKGAFREAAGGTLFLDEIGDLSPAVQAKLRRALGEREARAVGGTGAYPLSARVVAATNVDVRRRDSGFRQDLYERYQVDLHTTPLRDRLVDLEVLVPHLLGQLCAARSKPAPDPGPFIEAACRLPLTGNVRELRRYLNRAITEDLAPEEAIDEQADPPPLSLDALLSLPWRELEERLRALYLMHLQARYPDDMDEQARHAGVDRSQVYRWRNKKMEPR